jgi:hypothetical protein
MPIQSVPGSVKGLWHQQFALHFLFKNTTIEDNISQAKPKLLG